MIKTILLINEIVELIKATSLRAAQFGEDILLQRLPMSKGAAMNSLCIREVLIQLCSHFYIHEEDKILEIIFNMIQHL